jgi:hypothetical protein
VVSVTDPYGRVLGFLGRSRYFFFQVAPQSYSRGRVDPIPEHSRAPSRLAPTIYGEALLRVSPQDVVILPHHNILLNVLLQLGK